LFSTQIHKWLFYNDANVKKKRCWWGWNK